MPQGSRQTAGSRPLGLEPAVLAGVAGPAVHEPDDPRGPRTKTALRTLAWGLLRRWPDVTFQLFVRLADGREWRNWQTRWI